MAEQAGGQMVRQAIETVKMWLRWAGHVAASLARLERPMPYELFVTGWVADNCLDDWDPDMAWLCDCGHYQEDGWHCSNCGAEPPWGCDCSDCEDRDRERYGLDDDLIMWERYPGDLLPGDLNYGNTQLSSQPSPSEGEETGGIE